jgi:hypothetical protein
VNPNVGMAGKCLEAASGDPWKAIELAVWLYRKGLWPRTHSDKTGRAKAARVAV